MWNWDALSLCMCKVKSYIMPLKLRETIPSAVKCNSISSGHCSHRHQLYMYVYDLIVPVPKLLLSTKYSSANVINNAAPAPTSKTVFSLYFSD